MYLFCSVSFCLVSEGNVACVAMFSVKYLLNPQLCTNETEVQRSERYFILSVFMRKPSQLGRTFHCVSATGKGSTKRSHQKG